MKVRNVTREQMESALQEVNKEYDNNVIWQDIRQITSNAIQFTLKVKDSHGKGARLGSQINKSGNRRHLPNACWHVHGDFFDKLLEINPDAIVRAGNKVIDIKGGNWQDWNIGSLYSPLYYSEACECYS